jgi:hypothetical protein
VSTAPAAPHPRRFRPDWRNGWIAFALTLAGRLALVRAYGTSLPFQDPWKAYAVDILRPWIEGRLTLGHFFHTANDHLNTVSRTYSFALTTLTGEWNNLVEITGNAFGCALGAMLLVSAVTPALSRTAGIAFAWFAGLVLALPITWETTLMGMQLDVFAQVALTFCYLRIVLTAERRDAAWWGAHLAAVVLLLTRRSCVLVFPVAAIVLLWQYGLEAHRRKTILGTLVAMLPLLALYAVATPNFDVTTSMKADSWRVALDVFLRQIAWPLPHPAWALLMNLPCAWLILDRLGRRALTAPEAFVVAASIWAAAQAAAIAYGRGAVTAGFVSRYCDFLSVGLIANAAALALLCRTPFSRVARGATIALGIGWLAAAAVGLHAESFGGHASHNLGQRKAINEGNLAAVRAYFERHDASLLNSERIRETLYSYPPEMLDLLDRPGFRALLPPEAGAPEARKSPTAMARAAVAILHTGPALAIALAIGLTLWSAVAARRRAVARATSEQVASGGPYWWSLRRAAMASGAATVFVAGLFIAWPHRFEFDADKRWEAILRTAFTHTPPLSLQFESTVGRAVATEELKGAVATLPERVRPAMLGTLLREGTSYSGIVRSSAFIVDRDHLAILASGFPCWPGNALRWQFSHPDSDEEKVAALVVNPTVPGTELLAWVEDVRPYRGWNARLLVFDGNGDEHGWIGFLPPVLTSDPGFAARLQASLRGERAEATHRLLAALLAIGMAATAGLSIASRRSKRAA